jgi:thioredoxin-related protein
MKRLLIILFSFLLVGNIYSQEKPRTTNDILSEAYQLAAKENKKVFVIFHASWCYWCHKMDTAMNDATVRSIFYNNFIVRHLVVYESPNKKDQETPGALALLTKHKGNDEGIPYWLILDAKGNLIEDSKDDNGNNTGCPASKAEVDYFIAVLKRTVKITDKEALLIHTRFRQNEAKSQ